MAWNPKYRFLWTPTFGGGICRLDVCKDGYVGSLIEIENDLNGFEHNYEDSTWVQGFEGLFTFNIPVALIADYDADFFDSAYKEFKVRFYIDDVLKNVGWLKPENTTREINAPRVSYQISFTDVLKDLREVEYEGFENTGYQPILQIIKNALSFGGVDDLDFCIQCNMYETNLMSIGENLFKQMQIHNKAFYSGDDLEPDSCYTVIEKCIMSFYCTFKQADGYWQIINEQEVSSLRTIYAYADLVSVSENIPHDRSVVIDNFSVLLESKLELSKIAPVKALKLKWTNRYTGINEIYNPGFDVGIDGWFNGSGSDEWFDFSIVSNRLNTVEPSGGGTPNVLKSFSSDPFEIDDLQDGDGHFQISFEMEVNSIIFNSGDLISTPPSLRVSIIYPDSSVIQSSLLPIVAGLATYEVGATDFPITFTGPHTLVIEYVPNGSADIDTIDLFFDNISVLQDNAETRTSITKTTASIAAYLVDDIEVFFLDGVQSNPNQKQFSFSVIKNNAHEFASAWTRYNNDPENFGLYFQFSHQYLGDRNSYKDLIILEGLLDLEEQINYSSILVFKTKRYKFLNYSKNYRTKVVSGTIQQIGLDPEFTTEFTTEFDA